MLTVYFILCLAVKGCLQQELIFKSRDCGHKVHAKDVIHDVHIEDEHEVHKRSIDQWLRIDLHFDASVYRLPDTHSKLIKDKVWEAVGYWQDTLMVRKTQAAIRLNRQCQSTEVRYFSRKRFCADGCAARTMCGEVEVPQEHLQGCQYWNRTSNKFFTLPSTGPGVNDFDFILYVAAMPSSNCDEDNTVAYASHCQLESALDRPVAGYISICPAAVSTNHHSHEELLSTLKHEVLHALGFSAGLFAFYRDKSGQPLTPREQFSNKPEFNSRLGLYQWSSSVIRNVVRYDWKLKGKMVRKAVQMIVLPSVVAEVRRHFNCPTLEGAELEDQGIDGTSLTHWEKRVFENEAMTGTYTQSPSMSRITLALMEDTGWYRANYNKADPLHWGRDLGCDFVKKSCYEWIQTRTNRNLDIHPFCVRPNRGQPVTECTRDRDSVAICNLAEFSADLPPQYQYFGSLPGISPQDIGRYGGSVPLADYCPYLQELVWKRNNEILRGSSCSASKNNIDTQHNYLLESYSDRSKCFVHSTPWLLQHCNTRFTPHFGSGCYKFECSATTGLSIIVNGRSYMCEWAGKVLKIVDRSRTWLHQGTITCPSCSETCREQGVLCPPDRPATVVLTTGGQQHPGIPCRATSSHLGSSLSVAINFIAANILCFILIYLCHR